MIASAARAATQREIRCMREAMLRKQSANSRTAVLSASFQFIRVAAKVGKPLNQSFVQHAAKATEEPGADGYCNLPKRMVLSF